MGVAKHAQAGWTPELTERCRKLWREGKSAREIAEALGGMSRHAVIGRMYRLGEAAHGGAHQAKPRKVFAERKTTGTPRADRVNDRPGDNARAASIKAAADARTNGPSRAPHAYRPNVVSIAEPAPLLIPLLSLKYSHCRWPIAGEGADTAFCGHRKEGESSYCAHHSARASLPQKTSAKELTRSLRRYAA